MRRKTIERVEIVFARERTGEYASNIRTSKDVFEIARRAIWTNGMPTVEEFWVLLLNVRNSLVGKFMVSRGGTAECPITPANVFHPVILVAATSLIAVHNHPSGDATPSSEDRLLTVRLSEAGRLLGVKLLDHCIIAERGYYSFRDEGLL